MHREILRIDAKSAIVDHKDSNSLNNTKKNLRIATGSQNNANMRKYKGKSKFKGLCWYAKKNKWQVEIGFEGKRYYLGIYADEEEAARHTIKLPKNCLASLQNLISLNG